MMRAVAVALCGVMLLLAACRSAAPAQAEEPEVMEGVVTAVLEESETLLLGEPYLRQRLEVRVTRGSMAGLTLNADTSQMPHAGAIRYHRGDRVQVVRSPTPDGEGAPLQVVDVVRRGWLGTLLMLFVALVLLIGRRQGALSLVGLMVTMVVIVAYVLPRLYAGQAPVSVAIVAALLSIPASFYLSHGLNRKTSVAIVGTALTLALTGVLSVLFVRQARLTGFAAEEAGFLQAARQGAVSVQDLLIAGIIIGMVGVLDDVTVSQASVVQQLREANPRLRFGELYRRAMAVGRDHIASMVNTLVLVYTGAALPLLLLFVDAPVPFRQLVNHELIAEELVRTLVASSGLVLAVPVTTFLACIVLWEARSTDPNSGSSPQSTS